MTHGFITAFTASHSVLRFVQYLEGWTIDNQNRNYDFHQLFVLVHCSRLAVVMDLDSHLLHRLLHLKFHHCFCQGLMLRCSAYYIAYQCYQHHDCTLESYSSGWEPTQHRPLSSCNCKLTLQPGTDIQLKYGSQWYWNPILMNKFKLICLQSRLCMCLFVGMKIMSRKNIDKKFQSPLI